MRPRRHGGDGTAGFGGVSPDERRRADLFFDDLVGRPARALLRSRGDRPLLRSHPPMEHDIAGVPVLRPGAVGPAVDGTQNVARIALVSPSGAFEPPPQQQQQPPPPPPTQFDLIDPLRVPLQDRFALPANGAHRVSLNFAPNEPSNRFRDEAGYDLAGTDAQRWAALRWALFEPGNRAVLAMRGGHGATRLLDELAAHVTSVMNQQGHHWPRIPSVHEVLTPRRIVGFSDFTAVLLAAYSLLGWASIHGPMLCCQGNAASRNRLIRALTVAPGALDANNIVDGALRVAGNAPAATISGVMLGGNLALVDALYGSPFFPSLQGGLLFVEETGEEGRKIDRMIEGLKQRGAAAQAVGVVVGQSVRNSINSEAIATLFRRSWDVPAVFGLQAGHGNPNRAFWLGLRYELRFRQGARASLVLIP